MRILITGVAGFIGNELALRLIDSGNEVVGVDNLNDYYEVTLKQARLDRLQGQAGFHFERLDIADREAVKRIFQAFAFDVVINLAAQAGVRYSLENPASYIDSNLVGFGNILEGCRHARVGHLLYASSSSVYGANTRLPFSEKDNVDHPVSLYAATKKASELMAHSYAHLYGLPCTGLRFFTVYGPWGRPDMAYYSFTRKMLAGEPIPVFNNGNMLRDFTFIDDIIEGILKLIKLPPSGDSAWNGDCPNPATSYAPYRVLNIGNNNTEKLMDFIEVLQDCLGVKAQIEFLPMQNGDVTATYADVSALEALTGFRPTTSIRDGLQRFADWYRGYYGITAGKC